MKNLLLYSGVLLILIGVAFASTNKHTIKFHNQSKQGVIYFLYQIDHKLDYPDPIAFVIGTLKPDAYWEVKREVGLYYIEWKSLTNETILKTNPFTLDKDMTFVVGKLPNGK